MVTSTFSTQITPSLTTIALSTKQPKTSIERAIPWPCQLSSQCEQEATCTDEDLLPCSGLIVAMPPYWAQYRRMIFVQRAVEHPAARARPLRETGRSRRRTMAPAQATCVGLRISNSITNCSSPAASALIVQSRYLLPQVGQGCQASGSSVYLRRWVAMHKPCSSSISISRSSSSALRVTFLRLDSCGACDTNKWSSLMHL